MAPWQIFPAVGLTQPAFQKEKERGWCATSKSISPPPSLLLVVLPDLFARAEPKPLIKLAFKKLNKEVESVHKNKESLYGPFGLSFFFSSYSPLLCCCNFPHLMCFLQTGFHPSASLKCSPWDAVLFQLTFNSSYFSLFFSPLSFTSVLLHGSTNTVPKHLPIFSESVLTTPPLGKRNSVATILQTEVCGSEELRQGFVSSGVKIPGGGVEIREPAAQGSLWTHGKSQDGSQGGSLPRGSWCWTWMGQLAEEAWVPQWVLKWDGMDPGIRNYPRSHSFCY